jgi:hypothetical protein
MKKFNDYKNIKFILCFLSIFITFIFLVVFLDKTLLQNNSNEIILFDFKGLTLLGLLSFMITVGITKKL